MKRMFEFRCVKDHVTEKYVDDAVTSVECPHCHNEEIKIHSYYQTKNNGERKIFICQECESLFSETYNTPIAGLVTGVTSS